MLSDGKRKLLLDFWNKFILKSKKETKPKYQKFSEVLKTF